MGAQDNMKIVQDLAQAIRDHDERRYGELFAQDAVIRVAGVPLALGGVMQGRERILQNFCQLSTPAGLEIRTIFGDDTHVCAVERLSATFDGTRDLRGTGRPYTTYQCNVFRIEGGRIREQTMYTNWLDVYVQASLISLDSLRP